MVIEENIAMGVWEATPFLDEERKAKAARILKDYRDQQERLDLPLWPSRVEELNKSRERVRSVFDNPLSLDADDGTFSAADAVQPGTGDKMRKREANILYLADTYQADEADVRTRYDLYKADAGAKWGTGSLDDEAFFTKAKGEVDTARATEQRRMTVAQQAAAAALSGQGFLDSLATSGAEDDGDKAAFRAAYTRINKKLSPYRGLIGEVATDAKRMMTSGEGADWSALAERLLTVPKKDRPMVLDALNSMEGDKDEKGAGSRLAHAFARGLEDYIERTAGGAAAMLAEQAAGKAEFAVGLADVVGMAGAADGQMLNEIERRRDEMADLREMAQDARAVANATLSPLKDVRFLGANLTGVAENLPMTFASFVPFVGPASMVANMRDATDEELRREFPEMDRATRGRIATLSAPIQAATEVVSDRLLFGRLPNLKRAFSSPAFLASSIAKQLAGRVALGTATETLEELAQGITPRAIMEVEKALGADVPEVAWGEYFKQFGDNAGELLSVIVPMALLGAGVGQVSDYQNGRALVSNETLLKAAGYDNAPEIVAASVEGRWTDVEGMMRAKWAEVAPKGESVGEVAVKAQEAVIQQRTEEVKAATAEVVKIRELNEQAAAAVEQAERMRMIPRIRRDAQGWTVQDVETGSIVRVGSRDEAVSMAYESLNDLERKSAEAMAQGAEEFLNLDPKQAGVMELRRQGATPQTLAEEGVVTPEQAQAGVETYAQMHGLTPEEAKAEALWVLGNNKAEMIEGVRTAVSRVMGGGNIITVMHEGIHGRWNEGLRSKRYNQAMGIKWVRMAEMATGVQFLPTSNDAEVTPAQLDEAVAEVGSADLVGRRKDGKQHFTAGLISRGVSAFALSGRKDAKAAGQFAAWLKSWKSFWGVVLSNAKKLKKARAEGKLGEDFDSFLDDLLGAEPQQRFEAQAAQEAVTMVGEVDNAPFSLSPAGMASDQGAAQNAEPSTGGLTESELNWLDNELANPPPLPVDWKESWDYGKAAEGLSVYEAVDQTPSWVFDFGFETNEFFEAGRRGESPEWVVGYRKGKIPEIGRSTNWATGDSEKGVSLAYAHRRTDMELNMLTMIGVGSRDIVFVGGWAFPKDRWGSDGEIVVLGAKELKRPESSRAEVGASFSLAPRSLASVADTVLASRMKKPEFREAFYGVARQKMAGIRDQMDAIAGRTVDKTQEQWNREMKAREGFEYDRLLRENFGADTTKKQEALPVVDRQAARSEARTFAERWLEGEKKKQPTPKERQMAALRTLDAILSAFPPEIRGRVGGFVKLASLGTDKAREAEIVKRLDLLDQVVEKEAKKFYRTKIEDTFEKAKPKKGKAGEKPKGKLGAQTQALVDLARTFSALDEAGVAAERAAITDRMSKETDPAKVADLFEREQLLDLFGDLDERTSAELEAAAAWLAETYDTGRNRWRAVIEQREEQTRAQRAQAREEIGLQGLDAEQQKALEEARTITKRAAGVALSWLSFEQVMTSILGRGSKLARDVVRQARAATTRKTDALRAKRAAFKATMSSIFGTTKQREWQDKLWQLSQIGGVQVVKMEGARTETRTVAVEAVQRIIEGKASAKAFGLDALKLDKLADAWAENDSLPANRRKENLSFEVPMAGTATPTRLSQLQAVNITMLARQPGYTENMAGHGWTAEVLEEIEAQLTPEAKAIRDWLAGEYRNGYDSLNEVYARMYGVNLPRLVNYSPGTFEAMDMMGQDIDPYGQGLLSEGGFRAGMLKTRGNHKAAPRLEDALSVYWSHVNATEHFKAFGEFARDLRGVMNNADVRKSIKAKGGKDLLEAGQNWIGAFERNGVENRSTSSAFDEFIRRRQASQAYLALAYNMGTLMKQSTAALASLLNMGPGAAARQFAKLVSGGLDLKAAYNSDVIQRRLDAGFSPEVRQAMAAMMAERPSWGTGLVQKGMEIIGVVDAMFTTASYAMAYDYHLQSAKDAGMNDALAQTEAEREAEATVARTAQPSEMMDRSLFEMGLQPTGKFLFMFASEARQKAAIALEAYSPSSGLSKGERATRLLLLHVVFPLAIQTISNLWRDARDDGDDELFDSDNWRAGDYAKSMLLGPLIGIPLVGGALNAALTPLFGGHYFPNDPTQPLNRALGGGADVLEAIQEGDLESGLKGARSLMWALALAMGGEKAAAVGVGTNILYDAFRVTENLVE